MLNNELFPYIYKHKYGATLVETKLSTKNEYMFIDDENDEIDC